MTTTQLDGATIIETRGVSSTEYQIRGDELSPVLDAIESLFGRYAPDAYGTHVHMCGYLEGEYVARVSRLSSCE